MNWKVDSIERMLGFRRQAGEERETKTLQRSEKESGRVEEFEFGDFGGGQRERE